MQKIAVIFGGQSNENEISVITGTMAVNILRGGKYDPLPVYIAQDGKIYADGALGDIETFRGGGYKNAPQAVFGAGGLYILNGRGRVKKFVKIEGALNCCHGGAAEGGAICGLCSVCGLPLAGAQTFESAAFIDKNLTKTVLKGLGVKTVDYAYLDSLEGAETATDLPPYPLIVKPVTLGSSIGIEKVATKEELISAMECALVYDGGAIVERYIENRREINCAACFSDGEILVSECEEAIGGADILSFEDKYQGGGKSVFPAKITPQTVDYIKKTTKYVFEKLKMRGVVRFDYILDGEEIYLSEINTVPGSLSYYLLSGGFKEFRPVLEGIINSAIGEFAAARSRKLLWTGILESVNRGNKIK